MPYEPIRYSAEVQKQCRKALHDLLPSLKIQLQPSVQPSKGQMPLGSAFSVQIQQNDSTKRWEDKVHGVIYILAPLSHTGLPSPKYWFAVKLDFSPSAGDHILTQATILILTGEGTPIPFVRAEWDNQEPDGRHAQPHWHIYGSHLDMAEFRPPEGTEGFRTEPTPGKSQRIHYAMSATWHVGDQPAKSHYKALESGEQLSDWIAGCMRYLITQLIYFEGKGAPQAASNTQMTFGL